MSVKGNNRAIIRTCVDILEEETITNSFFFYCSLIKAKRAYESPQHIFVALGVEQNFDLKLLELPLHNNVQTLEFRQKKYILIS